MKACEMNAAFGLAQLKKLDHFKAREKRGGAFAKIKGFPDVFWCIFLVRCFVGMCFCMVFLCFSGFVNFG